MTQGTFTAPPQILSLDGLLFDFDGTIVDSTDGKSKTDLSIFYHFDIHLDPDYVLYVLVCTEHYHY